MPYFKLIDFVFLQNTYVNTQQFKFREIQFKDHNFFNDVKFVKWPESVGLHNYFFGISQKSNCLHKKLPVPTEVFIINHQFLCKWYASLLLFTLGTVVSFDNTFWLRTSAVTCWLYCNVLSTSVNNRSKQQWLLDLCASGLFVF